MRLGVGQVLFVKPKAEEPRSGSGRLPQVPQDPFEGWLQCCTHSSPSLSPKSLSCSESWHRQDFSWYECDIRTYQLTVNPSTV